MAPGQKSPQDTTKKTRNQLKAETSNLVPSKSDQDAEDKTSLKNIAEENLKTNPSALGDPVSLKAESSDNEPTENDRGALGPSEDNKKNSNGKPKL